MHTEETDQRQTALAPVYAPPVALEGLVRTDVGERFSSVDATSPPDRAAAAARAETVAVLPASMPALRSAMPA